MRCEIEHSVVFEKIQDAFERDGKEVAVLEGSARSTKTFSILQFLIYQALSHPGLKITCSRARLTWLKGSVVPDFIEILRDHFKIYDEDCWNKGDMIYSLGSSEFHFIGLDETQKVHGRKQNWFWINEAIEAKHADYQQLDIRTTTGAILDYNPSCTSHWIFSEVIPERNCAFIHSTYKDNPFLEQKIINSIEAFEGKDEVSWKIYGLGLRAAHVGLIFPDVNIVDDFPDDCKNVGYGQDFGFTNDPSCLVKCGILHGEIYVDEIFYASGLTNVVNRAAPQQDSIEAQYIGNRIPTTDRIWADSAEPKSIQELRNVGYDIVAADKGADSVRAGLLLLKRYKINVTARSLNLLKELQNYKWKVDKKDEKKMLNEPIDAWNHAIDPLRYWGWMTLNRDLISPSVSGGSRDSEEERRRKDQVEKELEELLDGMTPEERLEADKIRREMEESEE